MKTFLQEGCGESRDSERDQRRSSRSINRHPSLADIPTIASNCRTSPIMTGEKDFNMDRQSKAAVLDSDIARTENSIALLAAQSQDNQQDILSLVPATPPKLPKDQAQNPQTTSADEPLTPTANLKMLVSAASPAIRDRESKKRELFTDSGESEPPSPSNPCVVPSFALPMFDSKVVYRNGNFVHINPQDGSEKMAISRKDKSLGLLCQRFLAKYPENPSPDQRIEISLDEVAKDLSVERRRIYDIVNVLESVEVISRFAKNRYMWHGKTKLPQTLAKLKNYAMTHGFTNKGGISEKENPQNFTGKNSNNASENPSIYSQLKGTKTGTNENLPHLLPKNSKGFLAGMGCLSSVFDNDDDEAVAWARKQKEADYCRKDKSLGVLSQKFLMMFLISDTRQVTLDDAANLLIDEQEEGKAKYKTKVRRLYDIANILSSLQLIQKVHIHNIQSGRKPGFRWIGMDLDDLELPTKHSKKSTNYSEKPVKAKNSLVEKESEEESAFGRLIGRRPSQQQLRRIKPDRGTKNKLPRSRSDRVLTSKKRVLSCDGDNVKSSDEDGYSVQEINGLIPGNNAAVVRSPDSVKFHSELMKLKEQYPDRMQQLLSACTSLQGAPSDDKRSRRTLFVSEAYIDAPLPKRRRSDGDVEETSFSSPPKPVQSHVSPNREAVELKQGRELHGVKRGSPQEKILLERKKQKKLLEQQKNFQLEDERWKRMEKELNKAFSKPDPVVSNNNSPSLFDKFHPSVGIQASLIADVSPLKPLSHYVQNMQLPNNTGLEQQEIKNVVASSSPSFQSMGLSPLVSNSMNASTVHENTMASTSGHNMSPRNVKLMPLASVNLPSIWKMPASSVNTLQTTQPPVYLTMNQQQVLSSAINNSLSNNHQGPSCVMSTLQPVGDGNIFGNAMQAKTAGLQPVSLPVNIVGSLNAQGLIHKTMPCLQNNNTPRPAVNMQTSQALTPRMALPDMVGVRPLMTTPNQVTPILPKVTGQQLFSPMASGTPGSDTAFLHSEIAKKLVMPESNVTQS